MVAKLKNEVVVKDNFTRYKIFHKRKFLRKQSEDGFIYDYGDRLVYSWGHCYWDSGFVGHFNRSIISKQKSWNIYSMLHEGTKYKRVINSSNSFSLATSLPKAAHYRANRVLKKFCKRNDIKLNFGDRFDVNLRKLCYPVLNDIEDDFFLANQIIDSTITPYLRNSQTWDEVIYQAFGSKGKALRKRLYPYIEQGRFNIFNLGYLFRKTVPVDCFHEYLDDVELERPHNEWSMHNFGLHDQRDDVFTTSLTKKFIRKLNERSRMNIVRSLSECSIRDLRDVVQMVDRDVEEYPRTYRSLMELHDEVCAYIPNRRVIEEPFELQLSEEQESLEDHEFGNFKFVVPHNSKDLTKWSDEMGNCIRGYGQRQNQGYSNLIAVMKKKKDGKYKMYANVDVSNREVGAHLDTRPRVSQIVGKCNQPLPEKDKDVIITELEKFYENLTRDLYEVF